MLDVGLVYPLKPEGLHQSHEALETRAHAQRQFVELRLYLGVQKDERPRHVEIYLFCNVSARAKPEHAKAFSPVSRRRTLPTSPLPTARSDPQHRPVEVALK